MLTSDFANHLIVDDLQMQTVDEHCFCAAMINAMIVPPVHGFGR